MGADIALAFAIGGWRCDVIEPDAKVRSTARLHWRKEMKRLGVVGLKSVCTPTVLHSTGVRLIWQSKPSLRIFS